MNTSERIGFNAVVVMSIVGVVIAALVMAALAMDALWTLLLGFVALGLLIIALARVGVSLFARYTDAALKRDTLRYGHIETVMKLGYLPEGGRVSYKPIPQIEAPTDIPVGIAGVTESTVAPYSEDALNLLALSLQWQRESNADQTQIAPYHVARKSDYFRDVAVWMRAVQFLLVNQIGTERMRGGRKMGTYVITGTVEQAYQRMRSHYPPAA